MLTLDQDYEEALETARKESERKGEIRGENLGRQKRETENIKEEPFTCKREGLTIRGMQYFPAGFTADRTYPAVILSHGFTGNHTDMADYGRFFAAIGYIAYAFSFCGGGRTGEPEVSKSDGKSTEMTITTEVEDLLTVISYAKSQSFTDAGQLVLAGYSQGGFVSGLAAARCGEAVKKLIMISPALCIPDHARRGCLGGSSYDPQNVPETIDCGSTILGKAIHENVVGMEPFLELSAYHGKVLLIQGMEDAIVHYSYAVRAKACYQEGQCHLQLMRNQGHGYDKNQCESVFDSIRQFLADREEVLTIHVFITHCEAHETGKHWKQDVYFTGYCDTKYFKGVISPEGCDAQENCAGTGVKMRAEYTMTGLDDCQERCSVHIVNQRVGDEWKPTLETDSPSLKWLDKADLTAVLEEGDKGPTVRIFADRRLKCI